MPPEPQQGGAAQNAGANSDAEAVTTDPLAEVRALLAERQIPADASPAAAVRALCEEIDRLRPLADQGAEARNRLIDEALAEGVRAYGDAFATERYRGVLQRCQRLEEIAGFRDDWKTIGDRALPGGRLTQDDADATPKGGAERLATAPAAAYAG